jgi:hypothetical protein
LWNNIRQGQEVFLCSKTPWPVSKFLKCDEIIGPKGLNLRWENDRIKLLNHCHF